MGWEEVGRGAAAAHDRRAAVEERQRAAAVTQGAKVVMSPANKAYLDMKYDARHGAGLTWAAIIELRARTTGSRRRT